MKNIWLALYISGFVVLLAYVLTQSKDLGFCGYSFACFFIIFEIAAPLLYAAGALAIVFFILLFVPSALRAWRRFAIWFLPVAALEFITYHPGPANLFAWSPVIVYQCISIAYIACSLVVIWWSAIKTANLDEPHRSTVLIQNKYLRYVWYAYIVFVLWGIGYYLFW